MLRPAFAAVLCVLLAAAPARAAFEDSGFGPRDVAMGSSFTAMHDDVAALGYNPAGIGHVPTQQAFAGYLHQYIVPGGDTDRDAIRTATVLPVRQEILNGAVGVDLRYDRREGVARDRSLGFYYGTRGLRESEKGGLDFGGGLKFLSVAPVGSSGSGLKPALDFGALWRLQDRYSAGVSILNFGGAKFRYNGSTDRAPLTLKAGFAETMRGAVLTVDGTMREPSVGLPGKMSLGAGFERWWPTVRAGQFALRSGVSLGDHSKSWNWGMGWRILGAQLDYAMTVPTSAGTRVGHGFALLMRFGRNDPEAEYEKLLSQEMRYRRSLTDALESSSTKQWKLAEELARMREEMDALRAELSQKKASEGEARRRLDELERRRRAAADEHRRLQNEQLANSRKSKTVLFEEDWRAYQKAKLNGASDPALFEQLNRLLREYKDDGVDLGAANQELRRLQGGK